MALSKNATRHKVTQHSNHQHNINDHIDTQQNAPRHDDTQQNDTHHNDTLNTTQYEDLNCNIQLNILHWYAKYQYA
jgi:hypothetical protein